MDNSKIMLPSLALKVHSNFIMSIFFASSVENLSAQLLHSTLLLSTFRSWYKNENEMAKQNLMSPNITPKVNNLELEEPDYL